ncbi:unnamed protein product [Brassica oleracea]
MAGPVLKQRRLSGYFKRGITVDADEHARMVERVEQLGTEVLSLKDVIEKQARQFEKWKSYVKGKNATKKFESVRRREKKKPVGGREIQGLPFPRTSPCGRDEAGDRDNEWLDLPNEAAGGGDNVDDGANDDDEVRDNVGDPNMVCDGYAGVEDEESPRLIGRSSSEEPPSLLVRLKEEDGVPVQWVETCEGDNVLYRALTSQTYFVSEEEGSTVDGGKKEDGGTGERLDVSETSDANGVQTGGTEDMGETSRGGMDQEKGIERQGEDNLDALVVAGTKDAAGGFAGLILLCSRPLKRGTSDAQTGETEGRGEASRDGIEKENEIESQGVGVYVLTDGQVDVFDGSGEDLTDEEARPETGVLDVSDTSDVGETVRHEPVEQEAELAAVLLAKDQYNVPEVVPLVEDCDYGMFERVLMANLKMLHLNALGYDLENEFFIDLATPQKWVNSTHMDVLMEYVGSLHAETLRTKRAMVVAPWFPAHLQGKGRSFKAARRKTLIATDSRVTKFLTTEGKQWGVDVDTLYAPMIWGGEHWVGLCIRLSTWDVLVLDPNPRLNSWEEVATLMALVAEMLPYLARKVCPPDAIGEHQLLPFHVESVAGLYENRRSGHCGPVAAKFLEIHATGDAVARMAGLNDDLVDIFRKQYAMEIYKDWVVPLYMG